MEWRNFLWFKSPDTAVDICKFQSHWCFMLSSCFRFSSHRTCSLGFVSSTDAMIGGQAGRFSESTAFIQRITDSSFASVRLVCWNMRTGWSNQQLWIACNPMFGSLALHIWTLLFLIWLWDNFVCMCCICGRTRKDNDQVDARLRQRPSGCSTTTKWMLTLLCPSL